MRLIDADALIEAMKKTESEYENAMTCPSWWSAFNVISEQPTAYDIDKVVEEIIEEAHNTIVDFKLDKYVYTRKAIEIVKQGGVTNDVCEWKSTQINNEWKPSCEPNSTYNVFGVAWFKRCPYCGKKIKVVE